MLIIFLAVIALGLGLFAVVFLKEAGIWVLPVSGFPAQGGSGSEPVMAHDPVVLSVPDSSPSDAGNDKSSLLEQMLLEKNRTIAVLESDLRGHQSDHEEFEKLKDILQKQITDLKVQNVRLKDDLTRVMQEFAVYQSRNVQAGGAEVKAAARGPRPDRTESVETSFQDTPSGGGLELHDIFDSDKPVL